MRPDRRRKLVRIAAGAAMVAGGAVAVGLATATAGVVRAALSGAPATDDGPDELLHEPRHPSRPVPVESVDGARLNVVAFGADLDADHGDGDHGGGADGGDVVVLIHGWTCSIRFWNPQINRLAEQHRVVAYDQRGHGGSELGRRRPTIETLGHDLAAVLDAVVPPGRRAVLVGHSMGGMTIMSWAAQYSHRVAEQVSAVVLTSTAARDVLAQHTLIPATVPRYSRPFHPLLSRIFTGTPVPLPRNQYSPLVTQYLAFGPHARKAHVDFADGMIADCAPRARAGWGSAIGRLDVVAGLDALSVPTTVVVGAEDRLTPPVHARRLAEILDGFGHLRSLEIYDGAGHMVPMEAMAEYNELLEAVIAEVSGTAGAEADAPADSEPLGS